MGTGKGKMDATKQRKGTIRMELVYFKDKLFDLLNDSEGMGIADLNLDSKNDLLTVKTEDGDVFEIVCQRAADKEAG